MKRSIDQSDIGDKETAHKEYLTAVEGKSNSDAREIAKDVLGEPVFWNWDREYMHFSVVPVTQSISSSEDSGRLLPLHWWC